MAEPEKIRVDYPTPDFGYSGRLADGRLVLAYITGAAPAGEAAVDRVIAVRHLFDPDGNHLGTVFRVGGFCPDPGTFREDRDRAEAAAEAELRGLLADLDRFRPERCPIDVRPFGLGIGDVEYGFFYQPASDGGRGIECVVHMPRDHWYYPPWDTGEYDT